MPSPTRRSTRGALPITSKLSHHNSVSSSSANSSRPERATRAHRGSASPPRSQNEKAIIDDASDGEEEGGNEITRCICGSQDYPGPPSTEDHKALSEDSGNFFIQCDKCNVWQHGGCVGIMAEEDSPDNYSCEQCEKRSHQLHTDQKGQRYSLYLPVTRRTMPNHRKPSMSKEHDVKLKKERELLARAGIDWNATKRRSTMNSRQNYDEEEMLRKAIEESRGDLDTGSRKTKRGREEADDSKPHIKRQRTASESIEGTSTMRTGSAELDSDDDAPQTKSAMKRARAAAAETQRQREMKERERARDQQREEAAGRRQARAGRRRNEDDPDDIGDTTINDSMPPPSQPASPAPPSAEATQPSSTHKRSEKAKRGRNQYTKDRDPSPPRSKHGSSTTSSDDRKPASGKHSPASAGPEPSGPAPTSAAPKARGRSHKGKNATAALSAAESTTSADDFLPPVAYWNDEVLLMEREVLSWETELRQRVMRYPRGPEKHESYHANLQGWEDLRDRILGYKRRFVPGFVVEANGDVKEAKAEALGLLLEVEGV